MEWKDYKEENLKIVLCYMKESGDTAKDLSEGTGFSCDFIDKFLSGTIFPGSKLQEIALSRYDLAMTDGKVLPKR